MRSRLFNPLLLNTILLISMALSGLACTSKSGGNKVITEEKGKPEGQTAPSGGTPGGFTEGGPAASSTGAFGQSSPPVTDDLSGPSRQLGALLTGVDLLSAFDESSKSPKKQVSDLLKARMRALIAHAQTKNEIPAKAMADVYFDYLVEVSEDKKRDYEDARALLKSLAPVGIKDLKLKLEEKLIARGLTLKMQGVTQEPLEFLFSGVQSEINPVLSYNAARLYATAAEENAFIGSVVVGCTAGFTEKDGALKNSPLRTFIQTFENGTGRTIHDLGDLGRVVAKEGEELTEQFGAQGGARLNADIYTLFLFVLAQQKDSQFARSLFEQALENQYQAYGLKFPILKAIKAVEASQHEILKEIAVKKDEASRLAPPQEFLKPEVLSHVTVPLTDFSLLSAMDLREFDQSPSDEAKNKVYTQEEKKSLFDQALKDQSPVRRGYDVVFLTGEEIYDGVPKSDAQHWYLIDPKKRMQEWVWVAGDGQLSAWEPHHSRVGYHSEVVVISPSLIEVTQYREGTDYPMWRYTYTQEAEHSSSFLRAVYVNNGTAAEPKWDLAMDFDQTEKATLRYEDLDD